MKVSYSYPAFIFAPDFSRESRFDTTAMIYIGAHFRPKVTLNMGKHTFMGRVTVLVPKLTMKDGSQIGAGTVLAGRDEVILEENVVVGYNCTLLTASDTPKAIYMNDASAENKRAIREGPIICKQNSFIGSNCVLMPGIVVGERSVVGSGVYLDKSLAASTILLPKQQLIKLKR